MESTWLSILTLALPLPTATAIWQRPQSIPLLGGQWHIDNTMVVMNTFQESNRITPLGLIWLMHAMGKTYQQRLCHQDCQGLLSLCLSISWSQLPGQLTSCPMRPSFLEPYLPSWRFWAQTNDIYLLRLTLSMKSALMMLYLTCKQLQMSKKVSFGTTLVHLG